MNQPLLSVIVPCYNVENYLDKCILSIVNQTYPNLDILLIDDGSTDNSGLICDEWQKRDKRIRVIHKQNEGLAYVRKTGIENTTSEYITFVDADDWIDENMYISMMNALLTTHSDIALCGVCEIYEDGRIQHCSTNQKEAGPYETVDRIRGVLMILKAKEWQSYMCNKIFKKHLFDHVEFPKGRGVDEDSTIAHVLFHHASQTVYLRDEFYFYFRRAGSITNSDYQHIAQKIKNLHDSYNALYERYSFSCQHSEYQGGLIYVKNHVVARGIRLLRYGMMYPQYYPENFCNSLMEQLNMIRFTQNDMIKDYFTPLMRAEVCVFFKSPLCYRGFVILYAKIIRWCKFSLFKQIK